MTTKFFKIYSVSGCFDKTNSPHFVNIQDK